ncbi:unknown [Prevotella sp. CAG:891]|nr:unknown [Prevotella sp. CAG:891]
MLILKTYEAATLGLPPMLQLPYLFATDSISCFKGCLLIELLYR